MDRKSFRVEQASVYVVVDEREEVRWALYADDRLIALLEDEQECRTIADLLNGMPAPSEVVAP